MQTNYSIKDLEHLTGIKAHTIRIWEQRYQLFKPERSDTNIRSYSTADLKKILNINLLYSDGLKISKIAKLSDTQIIEKASDILSINEESKEIIVDQLIAAILDLNESRINELLYESYNHKGIILFYQEIISPLLTLIGKLWQLNSLKIIHEHFFSNILRAFILDKITAVKPKTRLKKTVLLFLHEEEEHEITLLFYHYLLKESGWNCIYLGANTPMTEIKNGLQQSDPDMILTSLTANISRKKFVSLLKQMLDIVPAHILCLSGLNTITFNNEIPENVKVIRKFSDYLNIFHS